LKEKLDIKAIYNEHADLLIRLIVRLTGEGGHVDDLLQETFLSAYNKQSQFDPQKGNLPTWLYWIAKNLCRNYLRSAQRFGLLKRRYQDEPQIKLNYIKPNPEEAIAKSQKAHFVNQLIQNLPFKHREVFTLYEVEGKTSCEIADMLEVSENTFWSRLHHARRKFKKLYRKYKTREKTS
jgi:RNA polymerase sigma-70 factor (ECF subfamily)